MIVMSEVDRIIKAMVEAKITTHRYNSYSTTSVYLKFDYGACYTLRIADHEGKPDYKYRYTLRLDRLGMGEDMKGNAVMLWYGADRVDMLIRDLVSTRKRLCLKNSSKYAKIISEGGLKVGVEPGFWSSCEKVA